jgi:hypothetical protein
MAQPPSTLNIPTSVFTQLYLLLSRVPGRRMFFPLVAPTSRTSAAFTSRKHGKADKGEAKARRAKGRGKCGN